MPVQQCRWRVYKYGGAVRSSSAPGTELARPRGPTEPGGGWRRRVAHWLRHGRPRRGIDGRQICKAVVGKQRHRRCEGGRRQLKRVKRPAAARIARVAAACRRRCWPRAECRGGAQRRPCGCRANLAGPCMVAALTGADLQLRLRQKAAPKCLEHAWGSFKTVHPMLHTVNALLAKPWWGLNIGKAYTQKLPQPGLLAYKQDAMAGCQVVAHPVH